MRRLLLFITILLISYCDRETKEKAYLPTGHILNKERKVKRIKNYESWTPDKKK